MKADYGPDYMGFIHNPRTHAFAFEFNSIFGLGPNNFASAFVHLNTDPGTLSLVRYDKAEFMNTNLQLITLLKSNHITAIAGIWIEPKSEACEPLIRLIEISFREGFRLTQLLYPSQHTERILTMLSISESRVLVTFGKDCFIHQWVIFETELGLTKPAKLRCVDSWLVQGHAVTCAKSTRGGRNVLAGTLKGSVLVLSLKEKSVLERFDMRFAVPVNAVEEGIFEWENSCVYAMCDMVGSIERFDLSEECYDKMYAGFRWNFDVDCEDYLRKHPKYAAGLKPIKDTFFQLGQDDFDRSTILRKKLRVQHE